VYVAQRDRAAGTDDARELAHRRGRVVDIAEEVREREMVEGGIGEGKRVGRRLDELHAIAEALAGEGQHLRALVEARHPEAASEERLGDEPGTRRDVEHVPAIRRQALDEEPAPARILPERESRSDTVVGRAERREERPGMAASLGEHAAVSWHGGAGPPPRA